MLHYIEEPASRIHVIGSLGGLAAPSLAIVGARKATPYGLRCAKHFARIAALRGITVISGGAVGCDQAAHQGALEIGGRTIVVLGCGADVVYPQKAQQLYSQVLNEGGALVSEAPWGAPPTKWGFRKRNRIIAALAQATLIVEAGLPSGTFSTADATLAQGKEVMAVPGSIYAKESKGANFLIAQGAIPVIDDESFEDALMQLFGVPEVAVALRDHTGDAQAEQAVKDRDLARGTQGRVLAALIQEPLRAEALCGVCGDDIIEVVRYLSTMELAGLVERLRDGRYAATSV
jgi:DNA processing protein